MKVLMVISQFNPIVGGAEKQAQLLARKLIEKGIEVNIVTGWWNFRTLRNEVIEGIKVHRNFALWGPFGIKGHPALKKIGGLVYLLSLFSYLLIHSREYDLIHVHQALYPAFVSILIGKQLLNKPVIVKTASSGMTSDIRQLRGYPLGDFQLRHLIKHMEVLVANSRAGGKEFNDIGFPQSRIEYIPNGVILPQDTKTTYRQMERVITISRLSKEKGVDILLRAWAQVTRQDGGLKLVILGDGPLERELHALSESLGIMESVTFMGMVQNVMEYVKKANLFVLPSRTEGLSNALLEAMSYGLPCVATNVGGNIELIGKDDNKRIMPGEFLCARNGLLVNPEDVEGISKAMLYLIRDEKKREELGRQARLSIQENYSIDLIADKYIGLYECMLNRKS